MSCSIDSYSPHAFSIQTDWNSSISPWRDKFFTVKLRKIKEQELSALKLNLSNLLKSLHSTLLNLSRSLSLHIIWKETLSLSIERLKTESKEWYFTTWKKNSLKHSLLESKLKSWVNQAWLMLYMRYTFLTTTINN